MADMPCVSREDRPNDAFIVDGIRVCPLAGNQPIACGWVLDGRPHGGSGAECVCLVPPELYGKGD